MGVALMRRSERRPEDFTRVLSAWLPVRTVDRSLGSALTQYAVRDAHAFGFTMLMLLPLMSTW